jgi:PAS domain S-box-containing protein
MFRQLLAKRQRRGEKECRGGAFRFSTFRELRYDCIILSDPVMKSPTRILVVDDERVVLQLLAHTLRQAGYDVITAATGAAGRQLAREQRPAVVLLDVRLPDANGVEICRELKQDATLPDLFVALCSGEASSSAHKVAGLDGGADDYLIKPIGPEELLARIRNLVRLRETTVALRASEQHFRQLVEILPDAVVRFDRAGRLRAANPQALEMWGYQDGAELLQRTLFDLVTPEEHERLRTEILESRAPLAARKIEMAFCKRNGATVPVELSVVETVGTAAEPGHYVAVARDMTERHQAEARRAAFSRLGKQLSEADSARAAALIILEVADQLLGWDCCHVRLVAEAGERIFPILAYDLVANQRVEVPAESFSTVPTAVTRHVLEHGALLVNGGVVPEGLHLTPFGDAQRHSAAALFTVMRQGATPIGILSIQSYQAGAYTAEDLQLLQTLADHCGGALERIRVAESLRESESRFRSLFESAPIGLALHDAQGHYIYINAAYQEMLGYSEEELRARGTRGVTVPEDIAAGKQFYEEMCAGQRNYYRRQKRYLTKTGRVVWAESSASAVRTARGELQFIVSMVDDITARKQAEAEIQQLTETLEQRVRERTGQLVAVNAELLESEQQLRLTLEGSNAGIWAWDAATNDLRWDRRNYELYGLSGAEAMTSERWLSLVHAADRDRMLARMQQLAQPGVDDSWNEEFRITHPQHGERWMAGIGRVIRDGRGKLIRMMGINLDITPRKQAEAAVRQLNESLEQRVQERTRELEATNQALRDSERRFRQVVENIKEVFWVSSPTKQDLLYISPAYETVWGQSCASVYANPQAWLAAIHPEDRARVQEAALTKQTIGQYDEQYRIVRPDGTIRWIQDRAYPVRNEDGNVFRVVGVAEDITHRKQTQEALRESEMRKGAIMESALDAIITLDGQGRILESNLAAERMFGHNRTRLLGQDFGAALVAPDLRKWFEAGRTKGFAGETGPHLGSPVEMTAVRAGGVTFPVEFSITRIAVDGTPLFTAFIRDITEQRRNEEQIRLLADAVQSTRELVSVTDHENRFTFVNQAFRETYGYSEAEILGSSPELLYAAANPAGLCDLVFQRTLAGGWHGEIINRRKDGTEFPIALSTSLIKSRTGQTVGLVGVARDISEAKRAEKQSMAFSMLSHRLSGATTVAAAAETIMDVASVLFNWEACYVHLLSPDLATISEILTVDTIAGRRERLEPCEPKLKPGPFMHAILKEGPRLINRAGEEQARLNLQRFGDAERPSASLMFVPIYSGDTAVGVISLQSYTPHAYSGRDLHLLQILANHCGDALRRIEVTEALRVAEAKYRGIFEKATEGIFQTTPEGRYLSANPAQARMLGFETPEALMASVTDIEKQTYVVPEQRQELKRWLETQGQVQGFEVERVRKDGRRIWTSINGHVVRDADGKVRYYECTSQDITQRKLAELELRRLSHLIIEAQEAERQRVARELHDGVNQLIASAKMRLRKVSERLPDIGPATREIFSRCEDLLVQALEENRRIAHNLRPTDLDHLGLGETCRNYCRELAARGNLAVKCRVTGLADRLPPILELNLFRIVQEATNNVVKHAKAKTIQVALVRRNRTVQLRIQDDGQGFDREQIRAGRRGRRGAGLTNMRERAAAMGGTCELISAPKQGTTITVRVPVGADE